MRNRKFDDDAINLVLFIYAVIFLAVIALAYL